MLHQQLGDEYLDALRIVKSVLADVVNPDRISILAHKCYAPIVLDGNPRRTLCRLYRTPTFYLGTINERKVETRNRIRCTSEIASYANELAAIARKYNESPSRKS